ncbi:MAG: methyl-accepting chemotaxis protein [Syntrophaceae bacterium]
MIIALVGVVSIIAATTSYSTVKKIYLDRLLSSSTDIARQMEQFYGQQEKNALFLAKNATVIEAAKTGQYDAAIRVLKSFFDEQGIYENIFISTAQSDTAIVADGLGGKSIGLHWGVGGYEDNVKHTLNKQLWISDPNKSPVTGRPVVLVSAPIMDGDTVVGILGLPFDVGSFSAALVKDAKVGKTGYPYITTSEGLCFAHPNPDLILNLDLSQYDWGKEILSKPSGTIVRYTFEGKDKFISFVKSEKYRIIAGTTIGVADINDYAFAMARNLIIVGVIGIVLTILAVVIFMNKRLNPLKKTVSMLSDIAHGEGDLTKRLEVTGNDEISELALWFNEFIDQLEKMVGGIKLTSTYVDAATQEVAAGAQGLSQATQEQASAIEEIAATIEEMTSSIKHNAANATDGRQKAVETVQMADMSGEAAQELVKGMSEISSASKKIGDIITTVNEVAFQTNLLALNAAVEAARAGEHGKGFAVVAEEVRALAQRSADASKQIKSLIEDTVNKIEAGDVMVKKSGESLAQIITRIQGLSQVMEEISAASNEQASGVDELNRAITQIDTSTQQNASTVEELASTSDNLMSESKELAQSVGKFRVSGTEKTPQASSSKKTGIKTAQVNPAPQKIKPPKITTSSSAGSEDFEEF